MSKKKKICQSKENEFSFRDFCGYIVIIITILYFLYCGIFSDLMLKYGETISVRARIDCRHTGKTSYPILIYEFFYDGALYRGSISEKSGFKINDSLDVIAVKAYPTINRPKIKFK